MKWISCCVLLLGCFCSSALAGDQLEPFAGSSFSLSITGAADPSVNGDYNFEWVDPSYNLVDTTASGDFGGGLSETGPGTFEGVVESAVGMIVLSGTFDGTGMTTISGDGVDGYAGASVSSSAIAVPEPGGTFGSGAAVLSFLLASSRSCSRRWGLKSP